MPDHYDKFTLKSGNNTSFKEMGSSIPGINHESEGNTDLPDGRSGSSAFQHSKIDGADHTKDGKGKHPGTYRAHNMERPEGYNEYGDPIKHDYFPLLDADAYGDYALKYLMNKAAKEEGDYL